MIGAPPVALMGAVTVESPMADTQATPGPNPAVGGRPEHVPTDGARQAVRTMTAWQIPQEDIAATLGISKRTLLRHYKQDVRLGLVKTLAAVNANLYRTSLGNTRGAVRAAIYLSGKLEARLAKLGEVNLDPFKATEPTVLQITAGAHVPKDFVL